MPVSRRWRFRSSGPALGLITDLAAERDGSSVDLTWTPAANATSHQVQRRVIGVAAPVIHADVQAYVGAVNTLRSANALSPMGDTEVQAWDEFWRRVGNRDGELSTNRQSGTADVILPRSAYNVGAGTELVALKGHILTRAGTGSAIPAWGTDASTHTGGDGRWEGPTGGLLTGQSVVSMLVVARATGADATEAIASQYVNSSTPGGVTVQRSASVAGGLGINIVPSTGATGNTSTGPAGYLTGSQFVAGLLTVQAGTGQLPRRQYLTPHAAEGTAGSSIGAVTVPAARFMVGNRTGLTNGFKGEIALVIPFNFYDPEDAAAILQIARETILAGVNLAAA